MTRRTILSLALLLCAWIPLWPLLTGLYFPFQHDHFLSDLLHAHVPYRVELHERLWSGQIPQWWPDIYGGVPLLAQVEIGAFYPPNLLTLALFDPYTGLNALWLFNTLAGALSAWWFARILGARPLVASVVGVTWALSGGAVFHLKHVSFHAAILLIPLVLATYLWCEKKPGRWPIFAAIVGLHALSGMPQVTWMVLLTVGILWAASIWPDWKAAAKRALGLGVASALGLMVAAVALLPAWGLKEVSTRRDGLTWEWVADSYGHIMTLATLVAPMAPNPYDPNVRLLESWFYQGLIVVPLAAVSLLAARRRVWVLWGAIVVLVPLMVRGPISELAFNWLPGMSLFRFHQRFGLVVAALLLGLAAIGLQNLTERVGPKLTGWLCVALVGVAVMDAAWFERHHLRWEEWSTWTTPGPIITAIPAGGADGRLLHHNEYSRFEKITRTGAGPEPGPFRPLADVPLGSSGVLHDRWSSGGYTNLLDIRSSALFCRRLPQTMPERYQPEQWDDEAGRPSAAWQSMLDRSHTRWVLTDRPVSPDLDVVAQGASTLFRNPTALPRAYVTTVWKPVTSLAKAADWMHGEGALLPQIPTIEGVEESSAPGTDPPTLFEVPVSAETPEQVGVDVSQAPSGWMVLTDTHYPGWTATVDGLPSKIVYANGYQRAVWLPEGAKAVAFEYRAPGLRLGAALSALALLLIAGWGLASRLRRSRG